MDNTPNTQEPKRRGRKPGTPKTPGSGRVKGRPPQVPENIRAVCREVLGLDNLAIRKRMKQWFESGDGLGSTTFRHVLTMGYGQPKHVMESGDNRHQSLIFLGLKPWERRGELDDITDRMLADRALEEKSKALEAKKPAETIETTNDFEAPVESLELVQEPPENFTGGRR